MVRTRSGNEVSPILAHTTSSSDDEPIYDTSRPRTRLAVRKVSDSRAAAQMLARDDGKRKAVDSSVKGKAGQSSSSIPAKKTPTSKVAKKPVAKDPPMARGIISMPMHFVFSLACSLYICTV